MGTHYFTAGYFNPILFTSAIGHQIPFSHSEGSFSERERGIQYIAFILRNLEHVVLGSRFCTITGEQENL